jgi:hypothetical protein
MTILIMMKNQLTKIMKQITKHNPVKRKNLIKQKRKFKEKKVLHLLNQVVNFLLIMYKSKKIIKVKS